MLLDLWPNYEELFSDVVCLSFTLEADTGLWIAMTAECNTDVAMLPDAALDMAIAMPDEVSVVVTALADDNALSLSMVAEPNISIAIPEEC